MTGPPEERKPKDPATWIGQTNDRVASLSEYFLAGAERYTPEALRQAASEAGYGSAEIEEAYGLATKRQRDEEVFGPIRTRAYRIVLAAYGLLLVAFAVPLLTVPSAFNWSHAALLILAIMLGISLLISRTWIRSRHRSADEVEGALLTLLAVPIVLLIAIGGLCAASLGPRALGLT